MELLRKKFRKELIKMKEFIKCLIKKKLFVYNSLFHVFITPTLQKTIIEKMILINLLIYKYRHNPLNYI